MYNYTYNPIVKKRKYEKMTEYSNDLLVKSVASLPGFAGLKYEMNFSEGIVIDCFERNSNNFHKIIEEEEGTLFNKNTAFLKNSIILHKSDLFKSMDKFNKYEIIFFDGFGLNMYDHNSIKKVTENILSNRGIFGVTQYMKRVGSKFPKLKIANCINSFKGLSINKSDNQLLKIYTLKYNNFIFEVFKKTNETIKHKIELYIDDVFIDISNIDNMFKLIEEYSYSDTINRICCEHYIDIIGNNSLPMIKKLSTNNGIDYITTQKIIQNFYKFIKERG